MWSSLRYRQIRNLERKQAPPTLTVPTDLISSNCFLLRYSLVFIRFPSDEYTGSGLGDLKYEALGSRKRWGQCKSVMIIGKCSESSMEVIFPHFMVIMTDRPTDRPTDGQTGADHREESLPITDTECPLPIALSEPASPDRFNFSAFFLAQT